MTRFGRPHLHLRRTDSTNERARRLAEQGAPSGTVVTAGEQTAGRGRRGRIWSAPPDKALLCSAIVRPLGPELALLPLAAPVAVCEAVESLAPLECAIKWPNDVWVAERKLGGILIEARPPDWAVIGIGLNATVADHEFPGDLRWPATSIGPEADLDQLHDAVCAALGKWVASSQPAVIEAYRSRDALAGRRVHWEGAGVRSGSGRATGVDQRGNLVVEPDGGGGPLSLGSGEVSLVLG